MWPRSAKQRSRMRSTLESYLRGKDTSRFLQDRSSASVTALRVVVKAEPGHRFRASSTAALAAGKLVFGTASTVEINNEIVAIEQPGARKRSIASATPDRCVSARSRSSFGRRSTATDLDVIQAKCGSELISGVAPVHPRDGRLELRGRAPSVLIRRHCASVAEDESARAR